LTIAPALLLTIYKYLRYEMHDQVSAVSEKYPKWAAVVAVGVTAGMRTFAVAHELAHVAQGHVSTADIRHMRTQAGSLAVSSKSHEQEFQADVEAQMLLLSIDASQYHPIYPPYACGGLCFFAVASMIETLAPKLLQLSVPPPVSDTHPDTGARIELLQRLLKKVLKDSEYCFLMNVYAVFDRYIQMLTAAEVERTDTGCEFKFELEP
jgi:hypothetical protein